MRTLAGLTLATLVTAVPAGAEELSGLTMHGFISQGWLKTTENELFFTRTTPGTFEITEAALSFSTEPVSRLRIGAQLYAQDLGSQGNHRVIVDWAVGDYRVRDWFGVRAGKLKLPLGLYGTLRDADIGRPEILQPESVYPDTLKDMVRSFDGAAVYGTIQAGRAGYLDYEAFGGAVDVDQVAIAQRFAQSGLGDLTSALSAAGLREPRASAEPVDGTMKHMYGGALEYRPPVQGLRLRGSGWVQKSELEARATIAGFLGPLPATFLVDARLEIASDYWVFASAEYQRGGLRVSAERVWHKLRTTTTVSGLPTGSTPPATTISRPSGWYVQVAQRVDDRLQLSAYYSRYTERDDKGGALLAATGAEPFHGWDKDVAFTARLDLTSHFLLKAEFHAVDGGARLGTTENPQGLTQNWRILAIKGTVHF